MTASNTIELSYIRRGIEPTRRSKTTHNSTPFDLVSVFFSTIRLHIDVNFLALAYVGCKLTNSRPYTENIRAELPYLFYTIPMSFGV